MNFEIGDSLSWLVTAGAGLLGRLMFHAREVQMQRRKPLSWVLFWDLPIALGMGWIALGLGSWLNANHEVTISIALAISYLGPHGIDTAFAKWSDRGDKESEE